MPANVQSSGERSEKPTAKRKRESRKEGAAARSADVPQAVELVVAALFLPVVVPQFARHSAERWRGTFAPGARFEAGTATELLGVLVWDAARLFFPMLVVVTLVSVAAQLALVGAAPNVYKLKPQWKVLNPFKGLKQMFSPQTLWELGKTVLKLGILTALTIGIWEAGVAALAQGPAPLDAELTLLAGSLRQLLFRAAGLMIVLALVDAVVSRRRLGKQLRMTKQEVKEEMRQQEGSPEVKGEIRRRQMRLSRNRMIASVATADVVVTNPTHLAIALAYGPDSPAPRVVAKGAGEVAKRIREEARKHRVPIRENKPLARGLFRAVEVGDLIPVEFYRAVAEVLAAVYRTRRPRRL